MPEFSSFMLWLVQQRLLGSDSPFYGYIITLPAPDDMRSHALFMDAALMASLPADVRTACESACTRAEAALDFVKNRANEDSAMKRLVQRRPQLLDRELNLWAVASSDIRTYILPEHLVLPSYSYTALYVSLQAAILLSRAFKVKERMVSDTRRVTRVE